MKREPKNLPASVRQRLLTLSQQRKEPFDLMLVRFGIERLLYRLSRSRHADKFLLKGAMLPPTNKSEACRPWNLSSRLVQSGPRTSGALNACVESYWRAMVVS